MPSAWTLLWFAWGLYFLIVEGMALANSTPGDTLSEHVWAWLGVSDSEKYKTIKGSYPTHDTSGWTWVRRVAVVFFMALLTIHFVIGSEDVVNVLLAAAGATLIFLVVAGFVEYLAKRKG